LADSAEMDRQRVGREELPEFMVSWISVKAIKIINSFDSVVVPNPARLLSADVAVASQAHLRKQGRRLPSVAKPVGELLAKMHLQAQDELLTMTFRMRTARKLGQASGRVRTARRLGRSA
jgi:hypothetical protein